MSVLDRTALAESPLADLHALANELGIDSYRRLAKQDLVESIVVRQGGAPGDVSEEEDGGRGPLRRLRSRGRRQERNRPERSSSSSFDSDYDDFESDDRDLDRHEETGGSEEWQAEGPIQLEDNGSALVHVNDEETLYVSAAQVRRCELVDGDVIGGPVRPARRSERHPALLRVETINGRLVEDVVTGVRFSELPVAYPNETFALGSDSSLTAVMARAPFGKGSRVTIVGNQRSGKSVLLRKISDALAGQKDLRTFLVLAGSRPEEIAEWETGAVTPYAARELGSTPEVQGRLIQQALEQARRFAARGGDAVVLVDTLAFQHPGIARKMLSNARNVADGGSLTVIGTSEALIGGETTVIALDEGLAAAGRYPAIKVQQSGTHRPESLVGDKAAEKMAKAIAQLVE